MFANQAQIIVLLWSLISFFLFSELSLVLLHVPCGCSSERLHKTSNNFWCPVPQSQEEEISAM